MRKEVRRSPGQVGVGGWIFGKRRSLEGGREMMEVCISGDKLFGGVDKKIEWEEHDRYISFPTSQAVS